MKIRFLGAASSVTGSCHLITTGKYKFLLDCGLYQGNDDLDELNAREFEFDPAEIDFMLLSHAHIDHSGRIPLLVKRGFKGRIYCTDATADLLKIMLTDSASIQEKETEWKNRKNLRAGRPVVEPLYTVSDASAALNHITPVLYNQQIEINDEVSVVFNDAGHILGSSIIEMFITENNDVSKIVYSGDLGVKGKPILRDPTIIKKADFLIMESTYGNRVHQKNSNGIEKLIEIILKTIRRGGNVIIPSFAVGRTQELIYELNRFYEEHEDYKEQLKDIFVYIDSPMATSATEIFRRNVQAFDDETKAYILRGNHPLDFKNLKFTRTVEESVALNNDPTPKVIISSSGMCEAGRIKHHLKHNLWNPKSSIVFVGYQAVGTLGRSLLNGDKKVTIFGEKINVEAEIYNLEGFSGHADQDGLLEWLSGFIKRPSKVFLVHGEDEAKKEFARLAKEVLGYDLIVVEGDTEYTLSKHEIVSVDQVKNELLSPEYLANVKNKISFIHSYLENILYNTHLALGSNLSPDQIANINNTLLELEKHTFSLGSSMLLKSEA
ncbi:MAG: MBL fold metallo-hydrolase [Clostridiaceae bacterium]|nr:MBL fold metallo-hydrolase [Clostridiaceae bacterium]